MRKPLMKSDEIKILEQLRDSDSYFIDTFCKEDIDIMISNIRNDFPILTNTALQNKLLEAKNIGLENRTLKNTIKDLDEKVNEMQNANSVNVSIMEDFATALLRENDSDSTVYDVLSVKTIISLKLKGSIPLNETDKNYIAKNLS